MKIIQNKYIPPKGFKAITLFGVVFAKEELTEIDRNHEATHIRQGNEMLWIFFYLWYSVEWLIRLIQYKDRMLAYYNISFEREAYANQLEAQYLVNRRSFSWVRYL